MLRNGPIVATALSLCGIALFASRHSRHNVQDEAAKWIFAILAITVGVMLAGCAMSRSTVRVPIVNPAGEVVSEVYMVSTDATVLRKKAYESEVTSDVPWGDLNVSIKHKGCDQGMSGNLSYLGLAAIAPIAPPLTVLGAAGGIAGAEAAKPDISHKPEPCPVWPGVPHRLPAPGSLPSIPSPLS